MHSGTDYCALGACMGKSYSIQIWMQHLQRCNRTLLPCYQLTKTECLYIATKFNDEARARLVLRWEELGSEK